MNIPNQWKVLHEALGLDNEHPELEHTFAILLMKLHTTVLNDCENLTTPSSLLHNMMVQCPDMYLKAFELVHFLFREVEEHGLNKSFRAILRLNKDLKRLHDENPEEMSAAQKANKGDIQLELLQKKWSPANNA